MNKRLYIQESLDDADPVNLIFTENAVTLRTFRRIYSPQDLDEYKAKQASDIDSKFEEIIEEKFAQANKSALSVSSLKKEGSLFGKYVSMEGDLYQIVQEATYKLNSNAWKPYSEICLVLKGNVRNEPHRSSIVFIDRNALTKNGRESFNQLNKRISLLGGEILLRWTVLPKSNLLTAPLIIEPTHSVKVITNLDFGKPMFKSKSGAFTADEKQKIDKSCEDFRSYWLPSLRISGPSTIKSNTSADFVLECIHKGGQPCLDLHEYQIETLSGFAPNKRVLVSKGKGNFRIMALGMRKGESLRFKINDGNWHSKAEKTLKVI